MNFFTPAEIVKNYGAAGKKKAEMPLLKMLILGFLSGMFIALGAAVTNTAGHSIDNVSAVRILSGLLFPGGLTLVVLMGGELFTGNCLMCISVLEKQAKLSGVLKKWAAVYVGNLAGSLFTAFACAKFGQMNYSGGGLAVFTMKLAASKCSLPFENAFVLGVFCNILVCFAVLAAMSAKDTAGKVLGLFFPICFFVVCGFEHSVANMYYVPVALLAKDLPAYAGVLEGIDGSCLTWGRFLMGNLLPVTLGNMVGGLAVGIVQWYCFLRGKTDRAEKK